MIETEKKYRLTGQRRDEVLQRLVKIGAKSRGRKFEENTIYTGANLDPGRSVLRLRRVGKAAVLTYKERLPTSSMIKHQREEEVHVGDADALNTILEALGFTPFLIYEKWRHTWRLGKAEIVVDELPFGLFMEIEATEGEIRDTEKKLGVKGLRAERATYPQLTLKHGKSHGQLIEARFSNKNSETEPTKRKRRLSNPNVEIVEP